MRTRVLVMFLASVVSACGPVVKSTVFTPAEAVSDDHPIEVFMTKAPECPYEELGVVTASQGSFDGGSDTYMRAMKQKAREMGGDAIINVTAGREASGAVAVAPNVAVASNSSTLTGTVIAFTDEDCEEE